MADSSVPQLNADDGTPSPAGLADPAGSANPAGLADPAEPLGLTRHQRAVASQVSRSRATIPAAFAVIKVAAEEVVRRQELISASHRVFVGFPELVIKAVAGLHSSSPRCFAAVREDLTLERSDQADIGVTIDVGTGLYVPVVRDAARLTVPEIAARLMDFRIRAMRRRLREEDMAGGSLTLALQMEHGIVLSQPIVFPGQSCTLSLCSLQQEVRLSATGTVTAGQYFHLGLAYDHRVINGRDAAAFLTAVKAALEVPAAGGSDEPATGGPDGDAGMPVAPSR